MFWPHIECDLMCPISLYMKSWHLFASELVLTVVDVPWDFEPLETVHHYSSHIFFHVWLFLDVISLELALIVIQDHISQMYLGNMIEAILLWFIWTPWPNSHPGCVLYPLLAPLSLYLFFLIWTSCYNPWPNTCLTFKPTLEECFILVHHRALVRWHDILWCNLVV